LNVEQLANVARCTGLIRFIDQGDCADKTNTYGCATFKELGSTMQFPAVNWHEGLFLQPHHFQAWDRHWSERVAAGEQWQNPYFYGISEIAINSAALAAGHFQLDLLKARTPGGALLQLSAGQQSERCDLRGALDASQLAGNNAAVETSPRFIEVSIGIPRLRLGGENVNRGTSGQGVRFSSELLELPDEVDASSIQPVELRRVNAHLLLSGQELSGYDALPLARVRRSEDGSAIELDPHYIPPLLDCSAWPEMRSHILSPVADLLARASEQAGQALADASGALQANSPIQLAQLMLLQVVNPAASMMRVMATSRGIHPHAAYLELARLAGSLDLFHAQRSVKATRAYDHDQLGPIFAQLKRRIVTALASFDNQPYIQKFFVGNETGLQTAIDTVPTGKVEWYIGVHKGQLPLAQLQLLLSAAHMDWKLGSLEQVERLFTQRAPGVELQPVDEIPAVLPHGTEWAYFKIDPRSAAWKEVLASRSLAIRIKDSMIANSDTLQGSRQLEVAVKQQVIPLRFALFGVS
jgi:type VI secretion system protein ImpJ